MAKICEFKIAIWLYMHPGTKLLFMGCEFGQSAEWNFEGSLDWHLNEYPYHEGTKKLITDLNRLYKAEPALFEKQFSPDGFED
jgi:1,4-alpha-glucan branching enzyme